MNYAMIGFVFTLLMKDRRPNYFIYYFAGANFFAIISGILNRAPLIFLQNENYIKKINLPKLIYILNAVAMELVNFFLSTTVLIVIGLCTGVLNLSWSVFMSLIPVALISLFLVGLSCVMAVMTVFFRDFIHIGPAFVQAAFFFTPVIYDSNMIPPQYREWLKLNPFYYFVELFRAPLLDQVMPSAQFLVISSVLSVVLLLVGIQILKIYDNQIVFKL